MSFIPKTQRVLAIVFIITTGVINATAQTPVPQDSLSTKPLTDSVSTNEPGNESKKVSTVSLENIAPGKISVESQDTGNTNSVEVASAPTASAASLSKTPAKVVSTFPRSPQAANADKWQFQFSPYFWLASLHGTGGIGNRTAQVDMSFGDIFGDLKFAIMGVVEARKDKFIVLVDTEYVSIADDKATPGPLFSNVEAKFKTFIFDPEVGYRLYDDPDSGASVDVLGGIRVWHVSTELNFGAGILPAVQLDGSRNWVDAIAGLRGKAAVSEKVFVSGKFDVGGGGSKFTWQVFGGLGYNIKPNIALIGGYRVLDVKYDKNNFVYDMNQRGPIMGLGFKF